MTNWIISHNPSIYRTIKAFIELNGVIDQATSNHIHIGDVVLIYLSAPVHKIVLKTIVIDENVPVENLINDNQYFVSKDALNDFEEKSKNSHFIRLKAVEYFDDDISSKLTLEDLRENGYGNGTMQGSIILENNKSLFNYIKNIMSKLKTCK